MKTARFMFVFAAATILLVSCGGLAPVDEQAPIVEQPQEPAPTSVPPTSVPAEPASAVAVSTQPQYAAFCEATDQTGCQVPTVDMLDNKYCIEKVPYAIMAVPAGTTYEALDPDMTCVDQMHSDGHLRITCHSVTSKELWSYDLKVCNGACKAPALQMDTGQCPAGYGYDPNNLCCAAPVPASGDGCTTYTVDIGACAEPQ